MFFVVADVVVVADVHVVGVDVFVVFVVAAVVVVVDVVVFVVAIVAVAVVDLIFGLVHFPIKGLCNVEEQYNMVSGCSCCCCRCCRMPIL